MTPRQIEELEEQKYSQIKNSLTPELLTYLTKKEYREKKEKGLVDEDEDDGRTRSECSAKVKRNDSEEDEEEEFDDEDIEDDEEDN